MATRWGICGAGKICWDFTSCLTLQPTTEHQVLAVAARQLDRAQKFAADLNIAKAYGSYEELAKDPNVEVVYIGTIHAHHHRLTLLFLNHDKHVLVEKPAAMSLKQLKEMTSLAREKKLFFMEGVWTRFFPAYRRVFEEMAAGAIGDVRMFRVEFGFAILGVEVKKDHLGAGALMSFAVYPIHLAVWLFGKPDKITVEADMTEWGVDEAVCIIFKYKDGKMTQFYCTINVRAENEGVIYGTNGHIKIHSPVWCPSEVTLPTGKLTFDLPETGKKMNYPNTGGFTYEVKHIRQCLLEGKTESPDVPMSHSELVMGLVDQIKKQIGLRYDGDD